jgi:hypothetical protein
MTNTYVLLSSVTVGSPTTSVFFNSISQSYADLVFVISGTDSTETSPQAFRLSGDGTNAYSTVFLIGAGAGGTNATSEVYSNLTRGYVSRNSSLVNNGNFLLTFIDYSSTTKHKTWIARAMQGNTATELVGGRWASSAAITSIDFSSGADNWSTGTTFHLYGIVA